LPSGANDSGTVLEAAELAYFGAKVLHQKRFNRQLIYRFRCVSVTRVREEAGTLIVSNRRRRCGR
jgi:aspartokinase